MGLDNPIHIAFLVVILLLLFGARRLPEIGRSLGTGMREFKDSISGSAHHDQQQLAPTAQPVQPVQQAAQPVQQPAQAVQAEPVVAAPAPQQPPAQVVQQPAEGVTANPFGG